MMPEGQQGNGSVWRSRWLVLVASMWLQACGGVGYVYGSYSPLIKSELHLNQKQMNTLGVAKDMGDSVGLFAGALSDWLPPWGLILIGSLQNLIGYGGIWLSVTVVPIPLWLMYVLILMGTNGDTYFNTVALVSCVRSFPRSRGPIVGILKGFTGLCGAIFTLVYAALFAPDQAAFILVVALGPILVGLLVMGVVRPVEPPAGAVEDLQHESVQLGVIYKLCMVLAGYLLVVLLIQDLLGVGKAVTRAFALGLLLLLLLPLAIPLKELGFETKRSSSDEEEAKQALLTGSTSRSAGSAAADASYFSELEEEKRSCNAELLPERVVKAKLERMQSNLYRAVAEGAVKVKKGPRRGENFTLLQALVKADFWLLFLALFCGAGSGLTAIDNLGQMGQAQGYPNAHIFVSMMSIWNFLGRVGGGFLSEFTVRDYAMPRPATMGAAQLVMAVGHLCYALAFPGSMYLGSLLVGLGYGAHWSIVPAAASELFGLKNFGSLYNFLTCANPLGSLLFSGVIAGSIYDAEAEKQFGVHNAAFHGFFPRRAENSLAHSLHCTGAVCFRLTFFIMTAVCIVGCGLSFLLVVRTKRVYSALYSNPQSTAATTTRTTTSSA